jgi:CxxC motif-containing protein (DUF1111 family)
MGVTTRAFPKEEPPGGEPLPAGVDPAPDPELPDSSLDQLTSFVRFLAAPAREVPSPKTSRDSVRSGQRIFGRIGCTDCHVPSLQTGAASTGALSNRSVQLYSDLLLHDLGSAMGGICAPNALPSEWRTAPLMGLRFRSGFLHDQRAQTVVNAINAHGGEAAQARQRFLRLSSDEQNRLLRFLASL